MGTALELSALLLVAGETCFIDAVTSQQSPARVFRHRVVAIGTGKLVNLMLGTYPVNAITTLVALEAAGILYFDGNTRFMGEADNSVRLEWIGNVLRARAMTCFTPFCF